MKTSTSKVEDGEIQEPSDDVEERPAAEKEPKPDVDNDQETGGVVVREHVRRPRKERREERQNDEVSRIREEAERTRAEFASYRERMDMEISRLRQGTQQIQTEDPQKARMRSIRSEQELIQNQVRQTEDAAERERLKARFYQLGDEHDDIRDTRITERAAAVARQAAAQASQSGQGEEAILRAEFPECIPALGQRMTGDQEKVLRYAAGEYQRLTAKGEPQTIATSRKAMQAAAEEFGMRRAQSPAPSLTQQQRFGSMPIQAGQVNTRNETHLNKKLMEMAVARWPNIPAEDAYIKMSRAMADMERREKSGMGDEIS